MSERGCIKCGYNLAGLPAAGSVVTCPECGQANDLAVPQLPRRRWWSPVLWGVLPVAVSLVFAPLASESWAVALAMSWLIGSIVTALLTSYRFALEPLLGLPPRPRRTRLALVACATVASLVVNGLLVLAVGAVLMWCFPY